MKSYPRIRKAVKWGGAVVTMLLLVAWVGSGHWYLFATTAGGLQLCVVEGRVGFGLNAGSRIGVADWEMGAYQLHVPAPTKAKWISSMYQWALVVRFSDLALVTFLVTGVAWWLDNLARRRARANQCPKCRYDLTGLAAGAACPECGRASVPS